uniref:Uncharacterized protein n=1 Tax=Utricularia reniformis TaxID=192314 RepID=A0A1Y0B2D7_9LAMI|nr:hypothetical protein AEK19_MT1418 [Utricularia reniformis]ART31612.1 hypothetical protein AEK19_MT1418 [Utricularia reniformis]
MTKRFWMTLQLQLESTNPVYSTLHVHRSSSMFLIYE